MGYVMAPDYWVYWDRAKNPGWPTMAGPTAPPAVWWQQRERWRDVWNRLKTGEEGTDFIFSPQSPPDDKKTPKQWWAWLHKHKKGDYEYRRLPKEATEENDKDQPDDKGNDTEDGQNGKEGKEGKE